MLPYNRQNLLEAYLVDIFSSKTLVIQYYPVLFFQTRNGRPKISESSDNTKASLQDFAFSCVLHKTSIWVLLSVHVFTIS
ncbi:hypothetical protein DsansV1_C11g0110071 [Dioscorea sansibarensis]